MRIFGFVITTVNRMDFKVVELAAVMNAPNDIVAALVLYKRLVTSDTTIGQLAMIQGSLDLAVLAQQKEKENGSDPQSGEIASESESAVERPE